ncbi:MAG: CPBP family glutamic-type intramembrane protease [Bacilli bacterium]|nr:CPBP family glutamic-type intramembrane protease [Bacilli bacterium]
MKKIKKTLYFILITFIFNYVILFLIPKLLACTLSIDNNISSKYLIGILVRMIGIIVTIYLIKRNNLNLDKKIKIKHFFISWLFIIYIIFNIELISINSNMYLNLLLMFIDAIFVGIYEELFFRGYILNKLIKEFNKTKTIILVLFGSLLFGLIHFMNLKSGIPFSLILYQVIYAFIIGIALSSIFIKTKFNITICIILHSLYDIASGFTDLLPKNVLKINALDINSFIYGLLPFVPLLLYSLFLLKQKKNLIKYKDYKFYIGSFENSDAEITFIETDIININHTFVNEKFRGQKIGLLLIDEVLKYATIRNKKILPTCSYAKKELFKEKYKDIIIK